MILIPVETQLPFFYSLSLHLLILTQLLLFSPTIAKSDPDSNPEAKRVHPLPRKRNNILIHHYARDQTQESVKKLRRLPHIFSRVLELPFRSDADVAVEEKADCFKFVADTDGLPTGGGGGGEIRAHTVEIHPGVTKIVVRVNGSSLSLSSMDELELDMWRFRLPDSIRPELVTVVCEDGELIVTVPKSAATEEEEEEEDNDEDGGVGGGGGGDGGLRGGYGDGRLVLVQ